MSHRLPRILLHRDAASGMVVDMKIVVDFDKCQSKAICMRVAPALFEVREDNFLYILNETPPEAMRESLEKAVAMCPTGAISIAEGGGKQKGSADGCGRMLPPSGR